MCDRTGPRSEVRGPEILTTGSSRASRQLSLALRSPTEDISDIWRLECARGSGAATCVEPAFTTLCLMCALTGHAVTRSHRAQACKQAPRRRLTPHHGSGGDTLRCQCGMSQRSRRCTRLYISCSLATRCSCSLQPAACSPCSLPPIVSLILLDPLCHAASPPDCCSRKPKRSTKSSEPRVHLIHGVLEQLHGRRV